MKKVISLIVILCMVLSAMSVLAEEEIKGTWGVNSWVLKGDTLYMYCDGNTTVAAYIPVNAYWKANVLAKGHEEKVKRIVFQEGFIEINACTAYLKNLEELVIPSTVTKMPVYSDLRYVIDENNRNYSVEGDVLFNKEKTLLIKHPKFKSDEEYTMPDSVETIGERAFYQSKVKRVVFGKNVQRIETYAFQQSENLEGVTLPESCNFIGEGAFQECGNIEYVNLSNVEEIGEDAFKSNTSLKEVVLPKTLKTIGAEAFYWCRNLVRVEIEEGLTFISTGCFDDCYSLSEVILPESITKINHGAFNQTALPEDDGAVYAGGFLISYKGEGECVVKEGTRGIAAGAFSNSLVKSVVFPEGIKELETNTFYQCAYLERVHFPNSFEKFSNNIFFNCDNLKEITAGEKSEYFTSVDGVLYNKDKTVLMKYPTGKVGEEYNVPDTVLSIGLGAFLGNDNLKKVCIPDSVTEIGENAFSSCSNLEEAVLGQNVKSIGKSAFYNALKLKKINFPNELVFIGPSAFHASRIEEALFNDKLEEIGGKAFYECRSLKKVTIENGIKTIGGNAFAFCSALESISIPDSVESVGDYAFQGCGMLKDVYIGSGEMGIYMFYGCIGIEKAVLADNVKNVSLGMFKNCNALKEAYIGDGADNISEKAFEGCYRMEKLSIGKNVQGINGSLYSFSSMKEFVVSAENEYLTLHEGVLFTKDMTKLISYPGKKEGDSYIVPDGVRIIGQQAFSGADKLKEIRLPDTIEMIDTQAFWECDSLKEIVIPKSLKRFGAMPFNGSAVGWLYYTGTTEEWARVEKPGANGLSLVRPEIIQYNFVPINVMVDDTEVDFTVYGQRPYIKNDRTLVPMRAIFEAIGATVTWEDETKTAIGVRDDVEVKIAIGENVLYKNGVAIELDAVAEITNDRTMVPVRAISEVFDYLVEWDNETKTVNIVDPSSRTYYTYDEKGQIAKTDSGTDYPYHHEYLYDDNGKVVREWQKTAFKNSDRLYKYEYNEKGQIISKSECKSYHTYGSITTDVPFEEVEKYFYDENGTLIYAEYPSSEKRYYIYDEGKLIREENEKGETLKKYVYCEDGKINYTENY